MYYYKSIHLSFLTLFIPCPPLLPLPLPQGIISMPKAALVPQHCPAQETQPNIRVIDVSFRLMFDIFILFIFIKYITVYTVGTYSREGDALLI
jgi:hypothetical protein